jgi:hypothetical protein
VNSAVKKFRKDGVSLDEAKRELKRIGLDPRISDRFLEESWTL